jgi:hypothetical protein
MRPEAKNDRAGEGQLQFNRQRDKPIQFRPSGVATQSPPGNDLNTEAEEYIFLKPLRGKD